MFVPLNVHIWVVHVHYDSEKTMPTLEWFTSHGTRQWSSWNALAKDFIERFAYNVEIVPNRYSLEKMKQKPTESYREFAYRWRKEV